MPDDQSQQSQQGAGNGNAQQSGVSLGTQQSSQSQQQSQTTKTGSGTGGGGDPWYKGLVKDEANLKTIETKKWDGLDATLKSYRELETAFSSRPTASAPSDPKEYTFDVPANMAGSYNQEFANGFRQWAHKAGLSKDQAKAIHDNFIQFAGSSLLQQSQASQDALAASVTKAQAELEKTWGAQNNPTFTRSLEMAKRAIDQLDPGLAQELRDIGAIVRVGTQEMIAKPAIFKALSKAGAQLFAEDGLYGASTSNTNPFDPKTADPTMQGKLIQSDPAKAKLLIRAAGPEAVEMYKFFLEG